MTATVWTQRLATSREGVTQGCVAPPRGGDHGNLQIMGGRAQQSAVCESAIMDGALTYIIVRTYNVELEEGERARRCGVNQTKAS